MSVSMVASSGAHAFANAHIGARGEYHRNRRVIGGRR